MKQENKRKHLLFYLLYFFLLDAVSYVSGKSHHLISSREDASVADFLFAFCFLTTRYQSMIWKSRSGSNSCIAFSPYYKLNSIMISAERFWGRWWIFQLRSLSVCFFFSFFCKCHGQLSCFDSLIPVSWFVFFVSPNGCRTGIITRVKIIHFEKCWYEQKPSVWDDRWKWW